VGNVGDNGVSSYRLHASETQQLSDVAMAVADAYPSAICVQLLEDSRSASDGPICNTPYSNTTVKILQNTDKTLMNEIEVSGAVMQQKQA